MNAPFRRAPLAAAVLLSTLTLGQPALAAELNPAAVKVTTPEQYKWRDPTGVAATNQTILHGDPTKTGGIYININKFKPGRFGVAHYHPNDRFITVIEGAAWRGTGSVVDPARATRVPKGTFMVDHANKVHWDGTKEESGAYLIAGIGPATNIPIPKVDGPFTGGDPSAATIKFADQYKWRDPTHAAPVNQAVLHGDPSKPGFYVLVNRYKPGAYSRPHFHPNDGFVYVLEGTLWVGTGTRFDTNNTVAMRPGTFMQHVGRQVHYQGAKDEEALIVVIGEGPATATPAEEK